jgi:hypothetical protein
MHREDNVKLRGKNQRNLNFGSKSKRYPETSKFKIRSP